MVKKFLQLSLKAKVILSALGITGLVLLAIIANYLFPFVAVAVILAAIAAEGDFSKLFPRAQPFIYDGGALGACFSSLVRELGQHTTLPDLNYWGYRQITITRDKRAVAIELYALIESNDNPIRKEYMERLVALHLNEQLSRNGLSIFPSGYTFKVHSVTEMPDALGVEFLVIRVIFGFDNESVLSLENQLQFQPVTIPVEKEAVDDDF